IKPRPHAKSVGFLLCAQDRKGCPDGWPFCIYGFSESANSVKYAVLAKKGYFHHENALLMTFTLKFLPFLQPLPQKKNAISIESFNLKLKPCFDYEV
uniref:hypothetical protein n=1 Tax=Yersinia rohdei TaxID=29485 RepID=UPI001C96AF92